MATVDLDAVRKARQEANPKEPNDVVLGGRSFRLPDTAPVAFLVGLGRLQKGDMSGVEDALSALFPDGDDLAEILRLGFSLEDLEPVLGAVYGINLGEAPASG